MANPWNAAIAYDNLADRGIVTTSSAVPLAPASRLQNPHVARKWRGNGNALEFVTIDLGASVLIDTVALMGLSLTLAGTVRVRVSEDDPSAQTGEAYDSDVLGGAVDPRYGMLVHLIPQPVLGRYVRIDLYEAGVLYVEAGRVFVGLRNTFAHNFAFGWTRAYVDRSRRTESRGGQTYVDPDVSYRVVNVSFETIPESDREGFVEEIDRVNGTHEDVLLITRGDSTNLGRDSIWGLMSELSPVSQPQVWLADGPAYAKTYTIAERL